MRLALHFFQVLGAFALASSAFAQQFEPIWVPVSTNAEREIDARSLHNDGLTVTYLARYRPSEFVMRVQLRCQEQLRAEANGYGEIRGLVALTPTARFPLDKQQESSFACMFAHGHPRVVAEIAEAIQRSATASVPSPAPSTKPEQSPHSTEPPLDLYCAVENIDRKCSELHSVDGYRFIRTCVTGSLRNGGYVALTDDISRASTVPAFCTGANQRQINDAILAHGGVHTARLLRMARDLTFAAGGTFAALSGVALPGTSSSPGASPSTRAAPPREAERRFGTAKSSGSGFAIGAGDVVITNEHVVSGCSRVGAAAGDDEYETKLIARDEAADLAALRLIGVRLPGLALSAAQEDLGGEVVVLGYPLTSVLGKDLRVTTGVISALSGVRGERKLMQVSAAVQPGNSGGPVIDRWGGVNGVVVAKLGSRFSAENVNFAVRMPVVRSFLELNGIDYLPHRRAAPVRAVEVARKLGASVVLLKCY